MSSAKKVSKWSQKSFLKKSENDTFESVKIESVGVDAHFQSHSILGLLFVETNFKKPLF